MPGNTPAVGGNLDTTRNLIHPHTNPNHRDSQRRVHRQEASGTLKTESGTR